ncbi:hypothetical protein SCATT_37670 [Streptantibioticus cattleyicolor NRRL 8057 = DSM 46488]|uniref:Uncharacterized protein n=1 Tax=Streptantibioticus cattleyicolor (strain ATCC 35852 / DSM 46488 / JCM 4925 / NBRC 14057 / NRRL 8057) TaxID=1003195 RepID=G8X306_STREN|nr:hypothetical protein SCATT_37670 [Streptantibioticus cattleyicolor NRRL 8057 = DSM 46488]
MNLLPIRKRVRWRWPSAGSLALAVSHYLLGVRPFPLRRG